MARLENLTDRGLETQNTFRTALIGLILEKGYDSVSIKDLTDRAGTERTTFYLHYRGKEDLLRQTQDLVLRDFRAIDPQSKVPSEALATMFLHIQTHRLTYQAILQAEALAGAEGRIVENGIQQTVLGGVLGRLNPVGGEKKELGAFFVASTLRALTGWWLAQETPCSPDEMADLAFSLVTRGLEGLCPGIGDLAC